MDATGSLQGGQGPVPRRGWPDGFSVVLSRAADRSVLWIAAGEPLEVTLDGEIAGTLPGSFEVAGNALRVITPRSFIDKDDDINQEMSR